MKLHPNKPYRSERNFATVSYKATTNMCLPFIMINSICTVTSFLTTQTYTTDSALPTNTIKARSRTGHGRSYELFRTSYARNTAFLLLSRKAKGFPTLKGICRKRASRGKISSVSGLRRSCFTAVTSRIFLKNVRSAVSNMFTSQAIRSS